MLECLALLENYLHADSTEHPLIRIGYIHAQFETIHPFLDGNGRLGRLLIALLLEAWGLLDARLLYLSLHFKRNQQEYYKRLDAVRQTGEWESWIEFFLDGICTTGQEAIQTSQKLFRQFEEDRRKLLASKNVVVPAIRLFELLPSNPVITVNKAVELLSTTKPTASKAIELLTEVRILSQISQSKRNRSFGYKEYLDLLKTEST
jgi:Fic family protein